MVNVVPSIVTWSPCVELNAPVVVATVPENVTVVFVPFSTNPSSLYTTKLACSPSVTTEFATVPSIVIPELVAPDGA